MDKKTLDLLEFPVILKELTENCLTQEGGEILKTQPFMTNPEELTRLLKESRLIRRILETNTERPSVYFPRIKGLPEKSMKQGVVLEQDEITRIGTYLRSINSWIEYINRFEVEIEEENGVDSSRVLCSEIREQVVLKEVPREIFFYFEENGELKESLPVLRKIRNSIQRIHREIEGKALAYMQDKGTSHYWQSTPPVQREGRTVLPMKQEHRGKIKGIIHEVSSSGATVFIEPFDILESNNQLVEEENKFRREVLTILKTCTALIQNSAEDILYVIKVFHFFDTLYTRGCFSLSHRGCTAEVWRAWEGGIVLENARHPLLGEKAVPISIHIGPSISTVIISGPNTGGKTVALKTIGLFVLLHQFGMELPVDPGSGLPVFENIIADIGDEQSIEASLSTFSGHMKRISEALTKGSDRTLVLLDELGSGTDPEEGVAIGMAVLETCKKKNMLAIATTHQGVLKNYAFASPEALNASVEFNPETLTPSYKILEGVPGESHALDIASGSGLPEDVVVLAREFIRGRKTDISKMIEEISSLKREASQRVEELELKQRNLQEQKRALDLKMLQLKQREKEVKEGRISELKGYLSESRKTFENLVREIRERGISKDKIKKGKQLFEEIEEGIEKTEKKLTEEEQNIQEDLGLATKEKELEPGMSVKVLPTGKKGTLVRPGKKGSWLVETETVRIEIDEEKLVPEEVKDKGKEKTKPVVEYYPDSKSVFELDLRGKRLEEALQDLEVQIDRAILNGMRNFSIIHGKGQGILKQGIHSYLSKRSEVDSFHLARPEQGGAGKTYVTLLV